MASIVLDLVVPGAGSIVSVLAEILKLCREMKESQEACTRVHRRLTDIFTELEKLESGNQSPSSEALGRYVEMLRKCLDYLSRYRAKPLYVRLLQRQKMMDEICLLNEEIDTLCKVLNIASTGAMMHWKQEWEQDCVVQKRQLEQIVGNSEAVLSEMRTLREQVEALTVLGFELQKKRLDEETHTPAKQLYNEIIRVSKATVETVPAWFIPEHDLEYDSKPFARGSFGALYRGTWGSGTKVVVKTLLLEKVGNSDEAMKQFLHEVQVWYSLGHPNVARMFGACHVTASPFIVCEDAPHGNLATFLTNCGRDSMWGLLHDAALGVDYLHRHQVVHGDLKLNNMLVGSNGAAQVADFGLSFVNDGSADNSPQDQGGLRWLAPECLTGAPTFQSDVYSFAMCIIEAVQGEPPFAYVGDDTVKQNLREAKIPPRPTDVPDEAWNLVVSMTASDPSKRPALSTVISTLAHLKETHDKATTSATLLRKPTTTQRFGEGSDVHELVAALKSDSEAVRYSALKWLYRKADNEATTHKIKQADGCRWLVHCFRQSGASWDQTIYTYACLHRMVLGAAITQQELKDLVTPPGKPTEEKLAELLEAIQSPSRDEEPVLEALEKIRWITEWDDMVKKHDTISALIELLRVGTTKQVDDATRTLTNFIEDSKSVEVIAANGAIPLLMSQFDVGSEACKERSAVALGHLSKYMDTAAPPRVVEWLAKLIQVGTANQKITVACAIKELVLNPANGQAVAAANVYVPLVEMLRDGSDKQKSAAAETLRVCLAGEAPKRAIADAGAIPLLVELARTGSPNSKHVASMALGRLASQSESRLQAIVDAGGIRVTVDLIRGGDDVTKLCALFTLLNLAWKPQNQLAISAAGALVPVIEIVRSGTDDQKVYATDVIANLALNNEPIGRAIGAAGGIVPLVALIRDGNDMHKRSAARAMERLAPNDDNARAMIVAGAIPALAGLAKMGNDMHTALAAAVLHLLSRFEPEATRIPIDIPGIVGRLRDQDGEVRGSAVYALDRLAALGKPNCETIFSAGGITPVVELVHAGSDRDKAVATSILQQLALVSDLICRGIVDGGAVAPLVVMLRVSVDDTCAAHAADILASIAVVGDQFREVVVDAGAVSALAACLGRGTRGQRDSALRALKNLAAGGEPVRRAVLKALLDDAQNGEDKSKEDALAALAALASDESVCRRLADAAHLSHFVERVAKGTEPQKKHATQVLHRLAESSNGIFQEDIVRAGGLTALADLVHTAPRDLKCDAALVLAILARRSPGNRAQLVKLNVVPPLVEMTRLGDDDQKTGAAVALGSLMKSSVALQEVKTFGGLDMLRSLVKNGNPEQVKAARRAISKSSHCHVS